jgi:hypothetical protein
VSNSNAFNSPLTSETRTFTSTAARPLLKIEQINNTNTATLSEHDLDDGEITFTDDAYPSNQICIYSPERDIEIEMEMYGGEGSGNPAVARGGYGGYSKIKFTLDQNVEYIITGLYSEVNAPFIYRKASLIAVVGGGGDAGSAGIGGNGGGVNISGQSPPNGGEGGAVILPGELPANGIYGSLASNTRYAEDSTADDPDGGRTIKCTKGIYWRNQGLSACEDIPSENKFRLSDGTEVQNTSSSITRGFKAGYNIIETKGKKGSAGGAGGSGATGGDGASSYGGGGGSGYTDGSVTVITATQGGSTDPAKVVIRLAS